MTEYPGFRPNVREWTCQAPTPILEFVAKHLLKERCELTAIELIELGAVYVDDERSLNPAMTLDKGDLVRTHTSPRRFPIPGDLDSRIVSETAEYLVIEKPAGLPTDPTVDNFRENLITALSDQRGQHFYLVHTLEAESSGLVMIAKTTKAQTKLKQAFTDGKVKRTFAAYVEIPTAVGPRDANVNVLSCDELKAETSVISEGRARWNIVGETIHAMYRVEVELKGGRPVQMRDVLAKAGSPVLGDERQGSKVKLVDAETGKSAQALRAIRLSI
ncbi:MAG: pseudouridine synthase [Bdellovibrionota bacterium]